METWSWIFACLVGGLVILTLMSSKKPAKDSSTFASKRFRDPKVITKKTGKKYLVTGGSGFLGGHVIEALLERGESNITCFDIRPSVLFSTADSAVKFIQGDITNKDDLMKALQGVDCVIHTAAHLSYAARHKWNRSPSYKVNYLGTKALVEACVERRVKQLLHVSSGAVLYSQFRPKMYKVNEGMPYAEPPYLSHYVETKILAEKEVLAANGKDGLKTGAVRPGGAIWGPRDPLSIPNFVQAGTGTAYGIGDEDAVQEWTYVRNVVHSLFCLETALETNPKVAGQAFFVGNDEEQTYKSVNQIFAKHFGCNFDIIPYPVGITIAHVMEWLQWLVGGRIKARIAELQPVAIYISNSAWYFDISKAKKELNYKPLYTIEEAAKLTASFYSTKMI